MDSSLFFSKPRGAYVLPSIDTPYQARKRPIVIDKAPVVKKRKVDSSSTAKTDKPMESKDGRKRIVHKPKPAFLGEARIPPEHGNKEIPTGREDCLSGKAFVQTGLGTYLTNQEISDLIFDHGGIERTAVSGKTDYLVAGFEMEDGRKIEQGAQYKVAVKKKVKIISDEDLMKLISDSLPKDQEKEKQ